MTVKYPAGSGAHPVASETLSAKKTAPNKYHSVKVTIDNIVFDSKREGAHYQELMNRQRAGEIRDLQLQVPFEVVVNDKKICRYLADFQYVVVATGETKIEDSKGVRTPVYRIKAKLVEALYGVQIVEV